MKNKCSFERIIQRVIDFTVNGQRGRQCDFVRRPPSEVRAATRAGGRGRAARHSTPVGPPQRPDRDRIAAACPA